MSQSKQQFAAIAFVFEAGLGLLAIVIGRACGFDPLQSLGGDKSIGEMAIGEMAIGCLWGVAATLPLLAALVMLDRTPQLLTDFKQKVSSVVVPMFEGLSLLEIATISAAAGFGEELLFRGLVQGGLEAWIDKPMGWAFALAFASVVFGVCHWLDFTYAVLATSVGIYLGGILLLTEDLAAPMIAHGLYDFFAILYLTRGSRRRFATTTSQDGPTEHLDR